MNNRTILAKNKIFLILLFSLAIRIILAFFFLDVSGFDQKAWDTTASLVLEGKNPYIETKGIYSFSPLWMGIVSLLKIFNLSYVIPVVLADLAINYLIFKKTKNIFYSLLFAANPVSLYVTSLNGNFDPLMILFLLLSYISFTDKKPIKSAIFFSVAILFKQAAILLPVFLKFQKNNYERLNYSLIAVFPFILSIMPFFILSSDSIIENVLSYHPGGGWWGYDVVLRKIWMNGLFSWNKKFL